MWKGLLGVLLGLCAFSAEVQASRARTMVVGSGDPTSIWLDSRGNSGSFFYDDSYNIFYNPALLASSGNLVIIEKSNDPGLSASGGLVRNFGGLKAGLFFNRFPELFALRYSENFNRHRPVEVLLAKSFAEDLSLGVSTSFSFAYNGNTKERNTRVSTGLRWGSWQPFAQFQMGRVWDAISSTKNRDYGLGLKFDNGSLKAWGVYRKVESNPATPAELDVFGLGAAHRLQVAESVDLYYSTGFWRVTSDNVNIVPFYLAFETTLTNWLQLRAGLRHDIYYSQSEATAAENTTGRLGATFSYANISFDWALGSNLYRIGQTGANTPNYENAIDVDAQSFGLAAGFFTAASLKLEWD